MNRFARCTPFVCAVLAAWSSGCAGNEIFSLPETTPELQTPAWSRGPAAETQLYARNGQPVQADYAAQGPTHAVQGESGSRMYLLELYQEAVDEREALQLELKAMNGEFQALRAALAQRDEELVRAREREAGLQAENEHLQGQNDELAARLITAQIRRLEAEKLLLEAKIEWLNADEANQTAAAEMLSETTGDRE